MPTKIPSVWLRAHGFTWKMSHVDPNDYVLNVGQYSNGNLQLTVSILDGDPYCSISVNLPNLQTLPGQFYVKLGGLEEQVALSLERIGVIRSVLDDSSGESIPVDDPSMSWEARLYYLTVAVPDDAVSE